MSELKYKRILLKLSGEALAGSDKYGINADTLEEFCTEILALVHQGVQVGIVVGRGTQRDKVRKERERKLLAE